MSKKIWATFALVTMWCLMLPICTAAQHLASLHALTKGKGTMVANGIDKYKITAVLVLLKENGDAQITLYSDIQIFAQGRWSTTKDPKVINLKISQGIGDENSAVKGKLVLGEDGKSIASLTAQGRGISGSKYEVNFVAEEKVSPAPEESANRKIARWPW